MTRREFINKTTVVLGLAQTLNSCSQASVNPKPPANFSIDLTDSAYSSLKTVGGVVFTKGVFIVRASQSLYIALSQVCTHAGCDVNYNSSTHQFVCPCHGGTYSINGSVFSGPPPSPLAQYLVVLNGTTLTVSG